MQTKKTGGARWIDIEKPSEKDLAWIAKEYGVHPVIIDELRGPSARGRVETYKDYLFFTYYFPLYDTEDEASVRTEIDFIVTKDTVITVHYDPIPGAMEEFDAAACESSLMVVYEFIEHLIAFEERQLRHIREKVENVGKEIFKDKEKKVLEQITYLKRDISEYRIVARLQGPILHSLSTKGKKFWGEDAEVYLNDLVGDQLKVVNQIDDYREAVGDFEDTNNQLMNLKINTAMKTFTSLSFLTFPFMLIAAIFSMKTIDMPLVGLPYSFWIIVGVMAAGMLSLIIYFKRKGWF